MVNYLVGEKSEESKNRAITLLILAHEQFHQLAEVKRSEASTALPTWIYESLAQYYGLKALKWIFGNDGSAQDLMREFINHHKVVQYTFPEVEAQYETHRSQALDLSYRQGATFWSELDVALQEASSGKVGLDNILPDILMIDFARNGALPEKFYSLVNPDENNNISAVIDKYF